MVFLLSNKYGSLTNIMINISTQIEKSCVISFHITINVPYKKWMKEKEAEDLESVMKNEYINPLLCPTLCVSSHLRDSLLSLNNKYL